MKSQEKENPQKLILAVDDISENLELLARNLKRFGHKTLLATEGAQALQIAAAKLPDLILLDVQMPVMNGFDVCRELKENPLTKDIPVIFLTAKTEYESITEAFSLGAVDYILKPFYSEELFARVNTHLKLKELSDTLKQKNEQTARYVEMIEHNIAISQTDANGVIEYVSEALCEISGYKKEELLGERHCCFKSGCTEDAIYKELWGTITKGDVWKGTILDKKKGGELFWAELTITPKLSKDGEIIGYLAIWRDVTDKKRVEELIVIDPMTELFNRRSLEAELNKAIDSSVRHGKLFGFLMIDIDHFKAYNDFYGHQKGDEALIATAKAIKGRLRRADDAAFRFGGEEFCAILLDIDQIGLERAADSIAEAVRELNIEHKKSNKGRVTVSIGAALIGSRPASFDEVVKEADAALYAAKESGRDRVCFS